MRDKRTVDELSIEELEQILMIRKREARMQRFRGQDNRRVDVPPPTALPPAAPPQLAAPVETLAITPAPMPDIPQFTDDGVPRFEDEAPAAIYKNPVAVSYESYPQRSRLWRAVTDKFLLIVEFAAIVGLMAVLYIAYQGIQRINNNIAKTDAISATSEAELLSRLIKPTATPELFIRKVVLPGGHIFDENGDHQFNINEVPASYRSAYQQQVLAAPVAMQQNLNAQPGRPVTIQIPRIGVNATVRAGDDWSTLQAAVGHHPYSGNPGQLGNMILTGHNDIYGEVFKRLEELQVGDEIYIQAEDGVRYTYVVSERRIADPIEDIWVLDQSLGAQTPIATLITCYPYRVNTHRMVIFAELITSS